MQICSDDVIDNEIDILHLLSNLIRCLQTRRERLDMPTTCPPAVAKSTNPILKKIVREIGANNSSANMHLLENRGIFAENTGDFLALTCVYLYFSFHRNFNSLRTCKHSNFLGNLGTQFKIIYSDIEVLKFTNIRSNVFVFAWASRVRDDMFTCVVVYMLV